MLKKKIFWMAPLIFGVMLALCFTGCSSSGDGDGDDGVKVVEAKYRFENGNWIDYPSENPGTVNVRTTTITTTTGINLSGVYTSGGEIFDSGTATGTWAYVYNGSGKIGMVFAYEGIYSGDVDIYLGHSGCSSVDYSYNITGEYSDMLDTNNGSGVFEN